MKNNKNIVVTERTATSIKKLVKKMNDSLYRLEKADLETIKIIILIIYIHCFHNIVK